MRLLIVGLLLAAGLGAADAQQAKDLRYCKVMGMTIPPAALHKLSEDVAKCGAGQVAAISDYSAGDPRDSMIFITAQFCDFDASIVNMTTSGGAPTVICKVRKTSN